MKASEINVHSKKAAALELKRTKSRDLMLDVERIKECAATYLPRNPAEVPFNMPGVGPYDPWQNRVENSHLVNMFKDAVEDNAGRVFAKPAKPLDGTPKKLVDFLLDVDGQGSNFQVFAKEVVEASLAEGEDFVLVDFPARPAGPLTEEQEAALRLAPFWRRYSAGNVLDWKIGNRGRDARLEYVKLREWENESVQVREIWAGNPDLRPDDEARWTRFQVSKPVNPEQPDGEWASMPPGQMKPQVEIPLAEFPSDLAAPFCALPPFSNLANLTIAHYRKLSNLNNGQNSVGFPLLVLSGFQLDANGQPIGVGPNRVFVSGDANAKGAFVEAQGTAWASVRVELDKMEEQGRKLSAEPMVSEASVQMTATDAVLRASGSVSRLESWVLGWIDSFSRLFRYTAIYMGIVKPEDARGWGGIELNRQYIQLGRNVEGARLAHERNIAGKLSDETAHKAMLMAEVIPQDAADWEEEKTRISENGPTEPTEEDRNAEDLTGADRDEEAA